MLSVGLIAYLGLQCYKTPADTKYDDRTEEASGKCNLRNVGSIPSWMEEIHLSSPWDLIAN